MISIQDLGLSIMSDSPKPFYVVGGSEYGVKDQYIDTLIKHFGKKEEYPSVSNLIDFLSVKHLIPVPPALYVVRYDDSFAATISAAIAQKIKGLKFKGTIFCIYSDPKQIAKIDKFLPDCTASVEPVGDKYVIKYLHKDFPKLDDRSIKIAATNAVSYGHARTICKSLVNADPAILAKMSEYQIAKLVGCGDRSLESDIQKAVAGRNFAQAVKLASKYEGDLDSLLYTILQTMIEMEKILISKYSDSPLKDFAKLWKLEDVYHMFMNTYAELDKMRSNTSTSAESSLTYLFGLLTFRDIPSVEVMNSDI